MGSASVDTLGGRARNGSRTMQRALRRITTAVSLAAVIVLGCAATSWALSPDDVIKMTKDGTSDDLIIQKICSDAEAWDLTSGDIQYLQDKGVSDDVVQALIDPQAASEKYGYTLGPAEDQNQGDEDQNPDEAQLPSTDSTPYVFTPGYYYGPLARAYFYDPFFYPYMYSPGFAFSIGFGWPTFYASYYYPYYYGYYGYPYFSCAHGSAYYGGGYCGAGYGNYRTYYQSGGHPYGAGTLSWHDWSGANGGRTMISAGGAVEQRSRSGQGFAIRQPGGGQVVRSSPTGLGGQMSREMNSGVIQRGSWIRGGAGAGAYAGGARVVRGTQTGIGMGGGSMSGATAGGRSWGHSRIVYGGGGGQGGQGMRNYMSAPSHGYGGYGVNRGSAPSHGFYGPGRGYGSPVRVGGGGGSQIYRGGGGGGMMRGYGGMGRGMGRAGGMPAGQGFGRMGGVQGRGMAVQGGGGGGGRGR